MGFVNCSRRVKVTINRDLGARSYQSGEEPAQMLVSTAVVADICRCSLGLNLKFESLRQRIEAKKKHYL